MNKKKNKHNFKRCRNVAWIISVDMGYGHQRAAYPLRHLAYEDIIVANTFEGISKKDKKIWKSSRIFYEFVSRFKRIPLIGQYTFSLFDHLQSIPNFYPRRDLSKPNIEIKLIYKLIQKGWLKDLIKKLNRHPRPIISTFFIPAFVADYWHYKEDIYCIITDTDMSRTWVAPNPKKSKIKYLAPTQRVVERLKLYGVPSKNIFLTGFPLPKKNIGGMDMPIIKKDIGERIPNLDPQYQYRKYYEKTVEHYLGKKNIQKKSDHPLTLTFSVGGAGAQREIAQKILKSLSAKIKKGKIRINLVAGNRNDVFSYFYDSIKEYKLEKYLDKNIKIIFSTDKNKYFYIFNHYLRKTDILWTKPSELSFYTGLGIPIIMAPPIGSQEIFNQEWLYSIGAGLKQLDPEYVNEWLFDWLKSGWLAKAAIDGFLYAPKMGTYNIEEILIHKKLTREEPCVFY